MSGWRSTYRRMRWAARRALGRDIRFPVETTVPMARHGSDAGEWWVCPRDLGSASIVYSLGIGTDVSFDVSLIESYGVTIEAFDPTPGSIEYVKNQRLPGGYRWHAVGIGARDEQATFFPPEDPNHISHTLLERQATGDRAIRVEVRRLSSVMRDLDHGTIDLLKMDIEGAEYDVLDEIVERGLSVQQILVEFHHRFPEVGIERTRRAVKALHAAGYRIFFASESGEEYSFIRSS